MSTHYSIALDPDKLNYWSEEKARKLVEHHKQYHPAGYPVLCYRGLSGTALGTALSLSLARLYPKFKFKQCYVRKPGERSHGVKVEHSFGIDITEDYFVFVDDFISSGRTREAVRKACSSLFDTEIEFAALCLGES